MMQVGQRWDEAPSNGEGLNYSNQRRTNRAPPPQYQSEVVYSLLLLLAGPRWVLT